MHNLTITDVRAISGDSAFLIDDGTTSILYDSGFAFTGFAIAQKIKSILGERELNYIFLTHSHYDHALGSVYVNLIWKKAKVVAGEYAVKIFSKPTARAVMRDLDQKFSKKCGINDYVDLIDELHVDIAVNDGDIIEAGDMNFTVVSLPGHTKCSIGFYLPDNKLLLSSETLGVYDGESTIIPSYLVGYNMTLDSIGKAEALDIKNLLLPHYGLLDQEKTDFYLKNARKSAVETASEITSLLLSGGTKSDAIQLFRNKFYHENVKVIYPEDAFELNTGIMVDLLERELLDAEK